MQNEKNINLIFLFKNLNKGKEDLKSLNTYIMENKMEKLTEKEKKNNLDYNLKTDFSKVPRLKIKKIPSSKELKKTENEVKVLKVKNKDLDKCIINIDLFYPESEKEYNLYKIKKKEFLSQFKISNHISINKNIENKIFKSYTPEKKILRKNLKIPKLSFQNCQKNNEYLNLYSDEIKKRFENFGSKQKKFDLKKPINFTNEISIQKTKNLKKKVVTVLKIISPFSKIQKKIKRNYNKHSLYTAPERNNIKYITPLNQEISWYNNYLKRKILEKKSSKMGLFWRGKNKTYPFTFKKVVNKVFDSTSEKSAFLIYDISKKLTTNLEPLFIIK